MTSEFLSISKQFVLLLRRQNATTFWNASSNSASSSAESLRKSSLLDVSYSPDASLTCSVVILTTPCSLLIWIDHGECGYRPFRVTDSQGREQSVVVVPQRVAQSGLANGPGGYAYTDDPAFARGGLVAALACAEVRPVIGTHSVLVVRLS